MPNEPAYITDFRNYTKSTDGFDQRSLDDDSHSKKDRAFGILQASGVELSLEETIKALLQPRTASMFSYPEPLSSFSAKIDFAYEIRLFGTRTKHDLYLIKELRNGFAHSIAPIKFSDPAAAELCNHFQILSTSCKLIPTQIIDREQDHHTPRNKFAIACYSIAKGLSDFRWELKEVVALPSSRLP